MKHYECGSLVPGCPWKTEGENEAELVRRAVDHLRTTHGETEIRPQMVEQIKRRISEGALAH